MCVFSVCVGGSVKGVCVEGVGKVCVGCGGGGVAGRGRVALCKASGSVGALGGGKGLSMRHAATPPMSRYAAQRKCKVREGV